MRARTVAGLLTLAVVLAVDQASKWWVIDVLDLPNLRDVPVLSWLNLTMTWNRGVTFGLFNDGGAAGSLLLSALAVAVVVGLGVWLRRAQSGLVAVALGAIAGGALGNVVDRLRQGRVTDFIHAHAFGYSWYVFNLADAAIVCGVAALVLDGMRPGMAPHPRPEPATPLAGRPREQ